MSSVRTRSYRSRGPLLGLVAALAVLATSCSGGGTGTQEDLTSMLQRDSDGTEILTTEQAECLSQAIWDEYGEDDRALDKLSAASSIEEIEDPENGVPGFTEFLTGAVATCVPAGPGS
jgi:hypothetical protein